MEEVREARERCGDQLVKTPCAPSAPFGEMFGGKAWFKFENLQITGSFKERGALNRMSLLAAEERERGVVTASAGNHAQAVAFHARRMGVPATVVMPERTPLVKTSNTERFGAKVILHGAGYDQAMEEALRLRDETGAALVHPFDDPGVIAGQGTAGLEILHQTPEPDVVVVPVGGGGLISGLAVAVKETLPSVRVVGVEAAVIPAALRSRQAGARVTVPPAETIAEGISVRKLGEHTFPLIEKYVDDLVTVDEEEIASAVLMLLEREKTVAEGAGAAGVAAVVHGKVRDLEGKDVVIILSGGNIDVNLLSRIIERGLAKDGRLARLEVRISDRPGALASLTARLAECGANILRLDHQRGREGIWLTETVISLTMETRGQEHVREIRRALEEHGYTVSQR